MWEAEYALLDTVYVCDVDCCTVGACGEIRRCVLRSIEQELGIGNCSCLECEWCLFVC